MFGAVYPSCLNPNNPFDGTAATDFLARLNGGPDKACYAGHCDWRLPTIDELEGIFASGPSCEEAPCPADDIFLPMSSNAHWSSTGETPYAPVYAWGVIPNTGLRGGYYRRQGMSVRAVRGGS